MNLSQLASLSINPLRAAVATLEEGWLRCYGECLILYLVGDNQGLAETIEALERRADVTGELSNVRLVAQLRYAVRTFERHDIIVAQALTLAEQSAHWRAEVNFVVAMYYETFGEDAEAKAHYEKSFQMYLRDAAPAKAAKSYHNMIAAESRINPAKRLICEYDAAFKYARDVQDFATAGAALNNLAREYQLAGALRPALKTANRAAALLAEHQFGSYQYYMNLVNRCDIALDLKHYDVARLDYEAASCAPFPEVRHACSVLSKKFEGHSRATLSESERSIATWRERSSMQHLPAVLTGMESRLVELLWEGAKSRLQLIKQVYGTVNNLPAYENRLKQLVHRIRKKCPDLIGFSDGQYYITESIINEDLSQTTAH